MNVSINNLTANPKTWAVQKSAIEPDPLRRWAGSQQEKAAAAVPGFEKPEHRPMFAQSLREAHYASMEEQIKKFKKIVVPPRHVAAVCGYGGVIPHFESSNIVGVSFLRAKQIAGEIAKKS